jgi:hypothetical protein
MVKGYGAKGPSSQGQSNGAYQWKAALQQGWPMISVLQWTEAIEAEWPWQQTLSANWACNAQGSFYEQSMENPGTDHPKAKGSRRTRLGM